jgi:hypothetical protein
MIRKNEVGAEHHEKYVEELFSLNVNKLRELGTNIYFPLCPSTRTPLDAARLFTAD